VLSDPERRRRYDREIFGREDDDEERPAPVEEAQAALFEPVRDIVPEEEVEEAPQKFEPPEVIAEEVVEEEISEPPKLVDSIEDRIIRDEDAEAEPAPPPLPPQTSEPHKTQEPPADLPPQPQLPTMPPISEDTEFTGDLLRQVREARGLTLEQMANTTKIAIYYLRYLEAEEYEDLPAKVYVKGYLKQIARLLKLDAEPMVKSYIDRMDKPPEE
jgi:flagellar biosynthesis protein FlhG